MDEVVFEFGIEGWGEIGQRTKMGKENMFMKSRVT